MKFGVSLWLWKAPITTSVIAEYAPKIAALGFDTMEVPLDTPEDLDANEAAKIIKDNGLEVSACAAMGPGRDLIHPDKEVRDNTIAYMQTCIEKAAALGSSVFVGPVYAEVGRLWDSSETEREKDNEMLVKQLQTLCQPAGDHGITLCVEPLNRFETSYMNLTSQSVEIIDRVGHPNCQVMSDLFHAGIEEKSLGDAVRTAGHRLRHVQVAENDRGTPGTGQFNWQELASVLKEINYNHHIVIETFSRDNELLSKAAAIWRPLAESPDLLASEGLTFLKKLFK